VRKKALLFLQKKKQKNSYLLGAVAPASRTPTVMLVSLANQSHRVIASAAKQSIFRAVLRKDGLLRCARNDAVPWEGQKPSQTVYSKSFLVLFFKKEPLAFSPHPGSP
jgi:hypothetical protein